MNADGTGDGVLYVRRNLYDFLFRTKKVDNGTWFWIDAICINQADIRERNHQVAQMGKIYQEAKEVRVWLGENGSTAQLLHQTCTSDSNTPSLYEIIYQDTEDEFPASELNEEFRHLLRNEYWTRTWVVQEVLLARRIIVQSGTETSSWAKFNRAAYEPHKKSGLSPLHRMLEAKEYFKREDPISGIYGFLYLFGHTKCTDPRDRVYAAKALIVGGQKIEVDYARSWEQFLKDVFDLEAKPRARDIISLLKALRFDFGSLVSQMSISSLWAAQRALTKNACINVDIHSSPFWTQNFEFCLSKPTCAWSQYGADRPCSECVKISAKLAELRLCQIDWAREAYIWITNLAQENLQSLKDHFQEWISAIWPLILAGLHDSSSEHCTECSACAWRFYGEYELFRVQRSPKHESGPKPWHWLGRKSLSERFKSSTANHFSPGWS